MRYILLALFLGLCGGLSALESTAIQYLSGRDADQTVDWQFKCSDGMRAGEWSTIAVPSCWEQQGFGAYTYGRYYHDAPGSKPASETGFYKHNFTVPAAWRGERVEIVFEGVMTDATVKINGKKAGPTHQGGFTRFDYDISKLLRYGGENTLEVEVKKESADSTITAAERKADWWLFGGIYRPVYLKATPRKRIRRVAVDARHTGDLRAVIVTDNMPRKSKLRMKIDGHGEHEVKMEHLLQPLDSQTVAVHFDGIKAWTPEDPQLYDLELELVGPDGRVLHRTGERIGFRTIEFRERDGFYLNGTKIKVKGVNRHCFYPSTGRTASHRLDVEDVTLIKKMNSNAIRSHYPPNENLLSICDSMGILYLNELPGWQNEYSTEVGRRILGEMLAQDVNHPSIFAWSNGNEGGFNYDLDPLFATYDPQGRHVVHAWADFGGVDAHHYPAYQTGVARLANGYKVFMPTEFLHAQYDKGAGASLDDFWANYSRNPRFAGGFIWAWADEGIARTDRGGSIDTDGPNGPDGIVGPNREREGSWYTIRDVWSPVTIEPFVASPRFDGILTIGNEYLFSSLDSCTLRWETVNIAMPPYESASSIVASKEFRLPAAAPGERRRVDLGIDAAALDADLLRVTVFDRYGDTVKAITAPVLYADQYFKRHIKKGTDKAWATGNDHSLKANGVEVDFDPASGMISRIVSNGREVPFGGGPVPEGMTAELKSMRFVQTGPDALIISHYKGAVDSIVWRMTPDGLLGFDAVMLNDRRGHGFDGKFFEDPSKNFGFNFSFPEDSVSGMTWLGRGPYRVWRNRQRGADIDRWHKAYNNTITGESEGPLVYPEFKGYHGNTYWARIESESTPFTVYSATDGLYLRMFTPQEPRRRRKGENTMVKFPGGDISFLLEIAPMRSYKPLTQLGPQAQSPNIRLNPGDEGLKMSLWFDFR